MIHTAKRQRERLFIAAAAVPALVLGTAREAHAMHIMEATCRAASASPGAFCACLFSWPGTSP